VKIFDFGLSIELQGHTRELDGTYKLTGMTGSLIYMAPEVANEKPYNETCDCHSFAILWWEMLALTHAFEGYTPKMLREKVFNGKQCRPTIDKQWSTSMQNLLRKSWAPSWQERYSMKEIKAELRRECVQVRGGDESGLEHVRRRSTFVLEEKSAMQRGIACLDVTV
jgi:serine/threonine protein kinase